MYRQARYSVWCSVMMDKTASGIWNSNVCWQELFSLVAWPYKRSLLPNSITRLDNVFSSLSWRCWFVSTGKSGGVCQDVQSRVAGGHWEISRPAGDVPVPLWAQELPQQRARFGGEHAVDEHVLQLSPVATDLNISKQLHHDLFWFLSCKKM